MENVIKFEVAGEANEERNSMLLLESHGVNNDMEITNTELDLFTVDVETNNQQSVETSSDLEGEGRSQFLFAPFDHTMRPDPELVRLETERSALDQEAATKVINDRYKLIMVISARRKEKEQRDKMKYSQISCNVANENILKTTQLSHYVDSDGIKKPTRLLHNMHVANENISETTQLSRYVDRDGIKKPTRLLHNMHVANENISETTQLSRYVDRDGIKKPTRLLHNMHVANENISETTQLSRYVDSEDIEETTQLLHNMHVAHENFSKSTRLPHNMHPTPSSRTKDQSEEFFERHLEKVFWHNSFNRFIKLNYSEINTRANISSIGMLNTVTANHERRVGEALNQMRNDQKDGVKRIAFFQSSRKLGSAKRKKTFEEFRDDRSGSP